MMISGKNMVKSDTYAKCKENLIKADMESL